jgi:1,2-diacylglycerol 3-alpha-glucosyltransferase
MLALSNNCESNFTSKNMSVCMVSDDFLPAMTGVGVHLKLITPELVRRGHRVTVITSRRKGEPEMEQWEGVTIYRVFTIKMYGFYQALPSGRKIRSILKEVKPDLIHHHYVGFMMKLVSRVAQSLKLRQVSTFHFGAEVLTQPLLMRPFRSLIKHLMVKQNNQFDLVMAPSQNVAKQITKEGVSSTVRYVSNPVVFGEQKEVVPAERTAGFTILYAGRLGQEKNIEYLIKGFAATLKNVPNAVLWVAGRGPQLAPLEKICLQLSIQEKVKFLGFLDHPSLARYYAACDVFVLPSLQEIQPLVVMEAMWFSKPVIVTSAIAAAEELVEQGVNGYIVDPKSVDDLSNKLKTLAENSILRTKFGAASRLRANAFRPELVVDSMEQAYQGVFGKNKTPFKIKKTIDNEQRIIIN